MKHILQRILTAILFALPCFTLAQNDQNNLDHITALPSSFFNKVNNKLDRLENDLDHQTDKYLEQLAKKENKLRKKLAKVDSNAAKRLFPEDPSVVYGRYVSKFNADGSSVKNAAGGEYMPYVDSLQGSLKFLNQNASLLSSSKASGELQQSLAGVKQLQNKFQSSDQIKQYIQQRKQELKESLRQYINNSSLKKAFDQYNQTAHYYAEQIREYKEIFNDPDKMLQKALVILNKIPAFAEFMKKNSQLAALFNIPDDYGTAQGLAGLQTREQVQQLLQSQIGSSGGGGMAALQSNLESAHEQLDQFKDKLTSLGGSSGDMTMPDFKPNSQKTHSFMKRLVIGTNLQTTRANYYWPTYTDIGLSIGYKLNDKSTIGLGGSYNIGWGKDINHIQITTNGASLRSFVDVKLKKNFYFSGGYELNYQTTQTSLNQTLSFNHWTRSGLIGISKMVSLRGKVVKQTKLQLLWDFLSYSQMPRTQPIIFRVGYNFK